MKEYNRLYELNNNGEVDNGVLINSRTQSSINMSEKSNKTNKSNNKNNILDLNISNGSFIFFNENDDKIEVRKINDKNKENNNNKNNSNEELDQKIKSNNILNQMSLMGFDKKYVLDCVNKNELCHASTVYYLMMKYENI